MNPGGIFSPETLVWHGTAYHLISPIFPELWSSEDGSHWHQLKDAPSFRSLVSIPNALIGMAWGTYEGCLPRTAQDGSWSTCAIWYSTDGVAWKQAKSPWAEGKQISTLAAAGSTALAVVRDEWVSGGPDPTLEGSLLFASSDGANWRQVVQPPDMAGALETSLTATRGGFVYSGFAQDPAGPEVIGPDGWPGSPAISGKWTAWFSKDGTSWSPFKWTSHGLDEQPGLVCSGEAGDAMPARWFHSSDGVSWSPDRAAVGSYLPSECSSNGRQVVFAVQATFYVGTGDGRWQELVNTGDVGPLPLSGIAFAVPNGVIYDAGGRVYFGRALKGPISSPTLAPAPTVKH